MSQRSYEYKGVTIYIYIHGYFLFYSEKDKYELKHGPWKRMNFDTKYEAEQFIDKYQNVYCW